MKTGYNATSVRVVDQLGDVTSISTSWGEGIINMANETIDYSIERVIKKINQQDVEPTSFTIIPETAGVMKVRLENMAAGEIYTISAAQVTANLGKPLAKRIITVYKTDTTATFSVEA